MNRRKPHYLLFFQVRSERQPSSWSFTLQPADGSAPIQASDADRTTARDRLELRTIAWALETLDQPSRVTLYCPTVSLIRAFRDCLPQWKDNRWHWERFGEMVPIANADLWKRIDQALAFHIVQPRLCRVDPAHFLPSPHTGPRTSKVRRLAEVLAATVRGWRRFWLAGECSLSQLAG